ncbi:hypothetical protein NPIL_626861 [Nephila pilipes]|uniref:Uncharacterized protein n=1 Tax=Nephila pilipes TaxID=299642 RepID=A0A8X6U4S7_NEPPI|nr:hypothetical protein NPIL_626861 [Nephila pilipes]
MDLTATLTASPRLANRAAKKENPSKCQRYSNPCFLTHQGAGVAKGVQGASIMQISDPSTAMANPLASVRFPMKGRQRKYPTPRFRCCHGH